MVSSSRNSYDVIIAGAGPAGSSLAIRLAVSGLRVLLIEKAKFPREKLCGEFISPECLVHFEELGILPEIVRFGGNSIRETIFYGRSGKGVSVQSEWFGKTDSLALGLSRAEMDNLLSKSAINVGVDVCQGTAVSGLLSDDAGVRGILMKDDSGHVTEVQAKLTVDATGRTQSLARRLEKRNAQRSAAKHVAFKTHLRGAKVEPGACEMYVYRGGYGGCNPIENDLYNLCFIVTAADTKRLSNDPERILREVVFTNKRARYALENSGVAKPWLAVPIERFGRGELVPANGLITVGDAAAFIDPFTGSGILLALESAKIAACSIARSFNAGYDFAKLAQNYKVKYSAAFDSRLQVCSLLRHAAFVPFFGEATISILSLNERLRRKIARSTRFNAGQAS